MAKERNAAELAAVAARVLAAMKGRGAYGRAKAVTQREIAATAGTNTRVLQEATAELVKQGVPIATTCGSPPGMFLAQTVTELQEYSEQLHARIVGNAVRLKGVRKMCREWLERMAVEPGGQRRLFV